MPWVEVRGVPNWVDHQRLLDAGEWSREGDAWCGKRSASDAADLQARLRNLGMGGHPIDVSVKPALKRNVVRNARTIEARRRRDATPGFTHPRARVDDEGRTYLTPETLALRLGRREQANHVLDATCGCGGNAIGFARAGSRVTAVDLNAERLAMARHNARVYGVEDQIEFVQGDALDHLDGTDADLVFLDPVWGVVDRIHCSNLPLLDVFLERSPVRTLAKLPASFYRPGMKLEAWFGEASGDRQRVKFLLLEHRRERL